MAKHENLMPVAQRYARVLPTVADVEELLWYVAYDMVAPLGYVDCVVYEVQRAQGTMRQAAAYGPKSPSRGTIDNPLQIPVGHGISGHVAATAAPLVVDDVTKDVRYVTDLEGQRSEVAVPIVIGNDVYGVIDCESPELAAFDEADVHTLTLIAGLVAPKIEALNTRVVCSTKKRKLAEHNLYLTSQLEVARNTARSATHLHTTGTLMQLSGGIAHDFNNQLAIMRGALDVAVQREGRISPDLHMISVAIDRATALTQRLLAFSSQQTLFPHCINFTEVLTEMQQLLAVSLETWITVDTDIAADLWNVNVDLGQLENAILNLVLNARDAMPAGGRIEITCFNMEIHDPSPDNPSPDVPSTDVSSLPPGDYVVLTITDGGRGMHPDVVARAFEPHFTTKTRGQGTGLGLSMVYGFMRQSGGEVTITSVEGEGTTVKLYFPRYEPTTTTTPTELPDDTPTPVPHGDGQQILVIEDNAEFAATVGEMLGLLDYEPLIAHSAADAVQIISRSPAIDAVLTDITLDGGISGGALINSIAGLLGDAPVIFMSGFAEVGQHRFVANLGRHQFLQKPFAFSELANKLHNALRPSEVE